ncbi:two-component, sensor histidine kinase [Methylophaga frappieri]|uniref:histidine kinase n=1 Tax=Methylophaga frappieri (strain ATCC BAA-2434 / DSM 25690 / JAM7) TaxID=754477 RepID=I1YIG7_METFJ|nr:ATP-binding protein [Methylophaga frappieri]AFJ02710.1 two-component, sensor histidine kinase [Methylophaga frappieri]
MRARNPIVVALLINILVTLLVALIAGVTAYSAINIAVERSVKEDVSRDIAVMLERAPERGIIPDITILMKNIGIRLSGDESGENGAVYLLANSNGEKIIGNAERMPNHPSDPWIELDGVDIGIAAGPLLLHRVHIEPDFALVVGRRLSARESLNHWFVPVMIVAVIFLGLCSSLLLGSLNHRFRSRIRRINAVFQRIEEGDLSARIFSTPKAGSGDELSQLSVNIDKALAEVERLLHGLESYSQVAAHELNHAISNLRNQIVAAGNTEIAAEADQLIELVTHILELAKIEATPGFAMKPLNLESVVQSVVQLYADAFEESAVTLKQEILCEMAEILGSRPLIESALVNLISNALKYAPPGSTVLITLKHDGYRFSLSVRDYGAGIEDTTLDLLAALGRRQDSGGHGFGLRHVEAVAIRHGAKLSLENANPGLRATLHFNAAMRS